MSATRSQAFSRFVAGMSWLFFSLGRQQSAIVKRSVFCAIISFAVLSLSLTSRVSSATAGETSLALESQGGDWIGLGQEFLYTPAGGTFSAYSELSNRVHFTFDQHLYPFFWSFLFGAPGNQPLSVGLYENARGNSFDTSAPVLSVIGEGHACKTSRGWFQVKEVSFGPGDTLSSLWILFEQHCEGALPALLGEIRYNANTIVTVAAPKKKVGQVGDPLTFTVSAKVSAGDVATLTATELPSGASFTDNRNNTGTFTWTPALSQTGSFLAGFEAANAQGGFDYATTSIAVGTLIRVPTETPSIQGAIDLALNGSRIVVSPGFYQENINFRGKSLALVSEQGPEVTVIDGGQLDSVVAFESGEDSDSVIDGFTVRNGKSYSSTSGNGSGGGIRISYSSPIIRNNVISDNRACDGSGVSAKGGSVILEGNIITANTRLDYCGGGYGGGGINISSGARVRIEGNTIENNFLDGDGGGISLSYAISPIIRNNIISGNTARSGVSATLTRGGGISILEGSTATITQNLIVGNSADWGGGIYWLVVNESGPLLVNNTIADNDSQLGSAVYSAGFNVQTPIVNNILVSWQRQSVMLTAT